MKWYLKGLKQYADFSGRAHRKEYWMFVLFYLIFAICAIVLDSIIGLALSRAGYGILYKGYVGVMALPFLSLTVRRLHDTGKSGWWVLTGLIPFWLFVLMLFDSSEGANRYGANPKTAPHLRSAKSWLQSAAITFITLAVLLIIEQTVNIISLNIMFAYMAYVPPIVLYLLLLVTGFMLLLPKSEALMSNARRRVSIILIVYAAVLALMAVSGIFNGVHMVYNATSMLFAIAIMFFAITLRQPDKELRTTASVILMIMSGLIIVFKILIFYLNEYAVYAFAEDTAVYFMANMTRFILPVAFMVLAYTFVPRARGQEAEASVPEEDAEPVAEPQTLVSDSSLTALNKPAVIAIIREKRLTGSRGNVTVKLNGTTVGTMSNKSFLLCKTTEANNTITLTELRKEIAVTAQDGDKIQVCYWYSGLASAEVKVESNLKYETLLDSVSKVSKGYGTGSLLWSLLIAAFFIWGGISRNLVLRFTQSSEMIVVVGVVIAIISIAAFIYNLTKEKAVDTLNRFLTDAGHSVVNSE
ncbi:MAG: DUF805 domain-containing protein [Prevotellaceae bacterium]|jgi:uncharacterized membrane protein YhaH (DUF805 family)|nr:DUF805 domain-containing protein [Prevotellaceae bacterium]